MYKSKNAKSLVEKYIIRHPNKIITCSLKKIASDLCYSEASIIKSIKLLGYEGLKDLKKKLFLKIKLESDESKQAKGLLIESLMATDRSINQNINIEKVIAIIKNRKIVLQGFGTSYNIALDFQKIFLQMGFDAFTCEFKEQLDAFENQTLFLLTTRGTSSLNLELIDYARSKNMKIVAITNSEHNLDSEKIDITIPFVHFSLNRENEADKNILTRYVLRVLVEMIQAYK